MTSNKILITIFKGKKYNNLTGNDIVITMTLEVNFMEKTATLNLRVNPTVKQNAEAVLEKLGIPMSTAIDMFLNQIYLVGGIPFSVTLPKAPSNIDASQMNDDEIHAKLQKGYNDYLEGNVKDASKVFAKFNENHSK